MIGVLVSPSLEDAREELIKAFEARRMVVMVADCTVNYSGRTDSQLGRGERLMVFKEDGCVLVHRGRDYQPVNWQPSGCIFQSSVENGCLVVKAIRPNPLESLTVIAENMHLLASFHLKDEAEFLLHASEEDMQRAILVEPGIIETGLKIVDFEKKVVPGFVDVYALDREGNTVVIEIKKDPAGFPAIKQLSEYLKHIHAAPGRKLRAVIVAPSLARGAQPLLAKMGIEFKQLGLQKAAEVLQNHARSDQKVLKSWLGS